MKLNFMALLVFVGLGSAAWAEDKTCTVKGMHCSGCADIVRSKVCGDKYSTCEVKIVSESKEIGEVRLVTKDATGKIDEAAVKAAIKEAGDDYKMQACSATAKASTKGKAPAKSEGKG